MTMKGEPVPPEGLDHINSLQKWLEQHPNDVMVRSKLAELQRDPRYAEPDEPDDIMPQVPELADFPVPPRLKKYIDATRIVAGASVPTSAACIGATFNLLAAEDIDVQSRANAPHPSGLYFVVGSESGWRKSSAFRETMQGHVEADERVHTLHGEAEGSAEDGSEFRAKGFSPRALRSPLDDGWGEVSYWPSDRITEGDWTPASWRSPTLAEAARRFSELPSMRTIGEHASWPSWPTSGSPETASEYPVRLTAAPTPTSNSRSPATVSPPSASARAAPTGILHRPSKPSSGYPSAAAITKRRPSPAPSTGLHWPLARRMGERVGMKKPRHCPGAGAHPPRVSARGDTNSILWRTTSW